MSHYRKAEAQARFPIGQKVQDLGKRRGTVVRNGPNGITVQWDNGGPQAWFRFHVAMLELTRA